MAKKMLIDATHSEETRVVVVSGNRLEEYDFETSTKKQVKGNIYLAKVTRVEPSLQACFVEFGGNRHGFLAFGEIHPDYWQIPVADREALMAEERRLAERDVRVVQILHRGWDQHGNLPKDIKAQCSDVDQPTYALLTDLKERGLLKDTLVVCGGEFGRTVYSQGTLKKDQYGRDHHPRNFCMWLAGGGVKGGAVYGETDDFSYNVVRDPVHLNDLNATLLHLMGVDHLKLTFKHLGVDMRLSGLEREAEIVKGVLA